MRIYPPDIVIEEDEGFTPEKDLFNRKEFGISLQNIFERVEDPLVVVLDEPWGMGKTTFIKMFAGHMRQNDFKVIYFDAFANDYAEGAFASLAGEIVAMAKRYCAAEEPIKKFVDSAVSVGKRLVPVLGNVGLKALTLSAVSGEDAREIIKSVTGDLGKFAQEELRRAIENHDASKGQREELREALSSIVQSVGADQNDRQLENQNKPLIVIIDELDRCKPTYALELIENIKHFFSTSSVHFLLVAHMEQLENSVRYSYGQSIDAATYLQKFYTFTTKFPQENNPLANHRKYIDSIINTLPLNNSWPKLTTDAAFMLDIIARANSLSFRSISKIASEFLLLLAQKRTDIYLEPTIAIGLCTLKITNSKLIFDLYNENSNFAEVSKSLAIDRWRDSGGDTIQEFYMKIWEYCLEQGQLPSNLKEFGDKLEPFYRRNRAKIIPAICSALLSTTMPK